MLTGGTGHQVKGVFPEYPSLDERTVRHIIELLCILGTLFLLDIVTTQVILWMGGVEQNPFMAGVVANPALHLGIKILILLLIFFASLVAEQRVKGSSIFFYGTLILFYIAVILHNLLFIIPQIVV